MQPPTKRKIAVAILLMLSGASAFAQTQQSDEDELAQIYGDKTSVTIATGSKLSIARAPAVASVITAQDIKAMGATELDQVLETVPGLHVSMLSFASVPIYSFRGIHTGYNPQVLMLVNGLPITNVFLGNRSLAWGGMPLDNVLRIEIIRGPGSALYGADAYSGVINVITRGPADIKGTEANVRLGSYHTYDASIQYGGTIAPHVDAALFLRYGSTDGQDGVIERDLQAILDPLFGTKASRTPGSISASRKALDMRADLSYDVWRLRAAYQQREVGMLAGLADSLDPAGRMPEDRFYLDLGFNNVHLGQDWEVSGTLGYYDVREKPGNPGYLLFPAGAFGGAFPTGAIGNPGHSERHSNMSLSAFYSGVNGHRVRLGLGYRIEDLYSATESKNFTFVAVPGVGPVFQPLPGLVDATHNPALVYMTPHKRRLSYAFAQDEWTIVQDWTLTAGVRYDRYSDFGSTTNPRLALVWDAAYNVVLKAMHGRAYRAPSFSEQFSINNPVTIGNPHLRPETINTDELALAWQSAGSVQANLTLFRYKMEDVIRFVANADPTTGTTAQNAGNQSGRGMELETTWDLSRNLRLTGSYSLQHSQDESTKADAGMAPHHRLLARADWRFAPGWQMGAIANHVADRHRQAGDMRPQIADYTLIDVSLNHELAGTNWELRTAIQNLGNRDAREPSFAPGNIPFDLPLPRRTLSVQLSYKM